MLMTTTTQAVTDMPLLRLMRATRLPPPAKRREIRERAKLSRRAVAKELGVSGAAVAWWEREDGFDPRPGIAVAYRKLLEQIEAETTKAGEDAAQK